MTGLVPRETVSVEQLQGAVVATGKASVGGTVQMSALVQARLNEGAVGISLLRAANPGPRKPRQTITIKQVALAERGVLTASAPILDLAGERFHGAPAIAIVTTRGFNVYDVRVPEFSRLVHHEPDADLRGVLGWHGGWLVWVGAACGWPAVSPHARLWTVPSSTWLSAERTSTS